MAVHGGPWVFFPKRKTFIFPGRANTKMVVYCALDTPQLAVDVPKLKRPRSVRNAPPTPYVCLTQQEKPHGEVVGRTKSAVASSHRDMKGVTESLTKPTVSSKAKNIYFPNLKKIQPAGSFTWSGLQVFKDTHKTLYTPNGSVKINKQI